MLEDIKVPLSQFKHTTKNLTDPIQHVSGFMDWWAKVNTIALANLEMVWDEVQSTKAMFQIRDRYTTTFVRRSIIHVTTLRLARRWIIIKIYLAMN